VNGCLHFNPAKLGPHIAGPTLVLDDQIYPLDHNSILVRVPTHLPVLTVDLVAADYPMHGTTHLPALTTSRSCITTGNNLNRIAPLNPFHIFLSSGRSQHFRRQ
jgi:hypothetical protein